MPFAFSLKSCSAYFSARPARLSQFANSKIEALKQELDKCMIVCSNCHKELHYPNLTLENISKLSQISNKKSFEEST